MVFPKGYFKLGDFGVARQQISGTMTVIGSYDFMAPEVYKGMPYNQTADIYSLGMVLYYLANDFKLPFSEIQSSIERRYRMGLEAKAVKLGNCNKYQAKNV